MTYGGLTTGHFGDGNQSSHVGTAIIDAAPSLIQGAWAHVAGRCAIIELWWYREPTPEERTESARAAVQAFLEWHGTTREDWESLRVRTGREEPALGRKGRLGPLVP